jgi:pimeloyl-ACP methyl ester carboxylesterase
MQIEPYLDAPPLHMSYMAGRSDRLILAFSGVGERHHPIPTPEAIKLTGWDGENHVLFISDASRSWMNADGLAMAIVEAVQQFVDQIHPARIIAFGNSMGGSMALIFASLFKLDAVLAIVPQYSVKDDIVPEENRWKHFRRNITDWPFPAVPPLVGNPAQIIILHGGEKHEMPHARRFRVPDGIDHYVVPQYDHSLAASLKKAKVLAPLIEAVIVGDFPAARAHVHSAGGISYAEHRQNLKAARRERRQNAAV